MKKRILIILTTILLIATPAFAAKDATESATEEIKEKIKERLEKTVSEDSENIEKETPNNTNTAKYHAWVGNLIKTESSVLHIDTSEGEKQAEIDDDTTILQTEKGKSRKEVEAKDLSEGNFILAMGTLKDDIIIAKRIISTPPAPDQPEKILIYGKVSEIEEEKITLKNGDETSLPVDEKETKLIIKGVSKSKFVDIQIEDKLYAVAKSDDNGNIDETLSIYIIPGKYNPENEQNQIEKESTPSAQSAESTPSVEENWPFQAVPKTIYSRHSEKIKSSKEK